MPLFLCDRCGAMENTALGAYWNRERGNKLCSECATGKWHGHWERITGAAAVQKFGRDQFCYVGSLDGPQEAGDPA